MNAYNQERHIRVACETRMTRRDTPCASAAAEAFAQLTFCSQIQRETSLFCLKRRVSLQIRLARVQSRRCNEFRVFLQIPEPSDS